jgi:hypothetical protein
MGWGGPAGLKASLKVSSGQGLDGLVGWIPPTHVLIWTVCATRPGVSVNAGLTAIL